MLAHLPPSLLHPHPYHLFHHHLSPSHARICRMEKALPPNGTPQTFAPNAGNCLMCMLKTWRNQGEHQHRIAHLS